MMVVGVFIGKSLLAKVANEGFELQMTGFYMLLEVVMGAKALATRDIRTLRLIH